MLHIPRWFKEGWVAVLFLLFGTWVLFTSEIASIKLVLCWCIFIVLPIAAGFGWGWKMQKRIRG